MISISKPSPAHAESRPRPGSWSRPRPRPTVAFVLTVLLLTLGLIPLPKGSTSRWIRQNARSQELNRADRSATAASYYEGLVNVGLDGDRPGLSQSLVGNPSNWVSFHDIGATHYMFGDVLQFELRPGVTRTAFGKPFRTNGLGLRDRDYSFEKPPGTFRIAVLGSSIDMGWGVADDETYENLLEDWLNLRATRFGIDRRFEVLNFGMAAYSPVHRRESFRRKASRVDVDLVVFSATMLDPRLTQIHLCGLLQDRADLSNGYEYIREAAIRAGITLDDLKLAPDGSLLAKKIVKDKVDTQIWPVIDATLGALVEDCRTAGVPLMAILVPRAGESDAPEERGQDVAHYAGLIARHGIVAIDLTHAFDDEEPDEVSVAPGDDHPNARGHKLLFRALARAIVEDDALYTRIFGPSTTGSRRAGLAFEAHEEPATP